MDILNGDSQSIYDESVIDNIGCIIFTFTDINNFTTNIRMDGIDGMQKIIFLKEEGVDGSQ